MNELSEFKTVSDLIEKLKEFDGDMPIASTRLRGSHTQLIPYALSGRPNIIQGKLQYVPRVGEIFKQSLSEDEENIDFLFI